MWRGSGQERGGGRGSGVPKEKMTPLLPSSHSLQQNNKKGPRQSRKFMFGKMASTGL